MRHNHNIHNGGAEIVRLLEYLLGRSSGRYLASHPFWYKRNEKSIRPATVADSEANTFQFRDSPQQAYAQFLVNPLHFS